MPHGSDYNDYVQNMIDECVEALEDEDANLSPWEEKFIVSVAEQWERRGSLSPKQLEFLEKAHKHSQEKSWP